MVAHFVSNVVLNLTLKTKNLNSEICVLRGAIEQSEPDEINGLLVQIDRMTAKLVDVWREQEE